MMSKSVKIVFINNGYYDDYEDRYIRSEISRGITDWEEISDDDYKILNDNLYLLEKKFNVKGRPIVVTKNDVEAQDVIIGIKQTLDEIKAETEKKVKAAELARITKMQKKAAKTAEDKRRLYDILKKEFE